ncbi:MAG TPA: YbgC/FadM family acyl-CoA thioesterase [Alicycliphilus sp.]|nr:YbgC/FadM family acyl-CoA thioesterase [Alicycliphilus sp.]
MKRSDFRHLERLRVRWAEVDMQQIVFNGHYLMYFDTAVAGYWRALAVPYHDTMAQLQGDLYVRKATLEYLVSARYDEQLHVGIRCARIGNSSAQFQAAVFRGEALLVHGELVYVFADPAAQSSKPVPAALRALLEGFEAGAPVVQLRCGDWKSLGEAARGIRQQVFVAEQGIAADLVVDEADPGAVHAVAFNHFGLPVASGRLLQREPGLAQIGRMATLASVRGAQLGHTVLQALMEQARQRGDHAVMLQAQTSAVPFYLRAGFSCEGDVFEAAGVPHQTMRRAL